jgi:hypothetical protein
LFARDQEIEDYIASLGFSYDIVDGQQETINILHGELNSVNMELSVVRTRAAKNAALALLAFGLIAIEVFAVALYVLPK